jgi:succinoglycan biosynthesis transport protein ExoP
MYTEAKAGDLLGILRRALPMITAITFAGTLLICVGPVLMPPQYTAKSEILIEPQGLIATQGSVVELPADEAAIQTEIAALTSPDLLQRMLESLPSDQAFKAAAKAALDGPDWIGGDLWRRVSRWAPRSWFTATGEPGPIIVRQLLRHLRVSQETVSHVIAVNVTSISTEEAAAVANHLTHLYVESQAEQKRGSTDRTLAWLAVRVPELNSKVKRLDAAVQSYRVEHNLAGSNPAAVSDGQIDDLNRKLAAAESESATLNARLDILHDLQQHSASLGSLVSYLNTPTLTKLRDRELTLRQNQAVGDNNFVAGSPIMSKLRSELAEVRLQMSQEVARAAADLNRDVQVATAQKQSVKQRLAAIQTATADTSLGELEREAASTRHLYENMLLRQEQLREQRESLSPGVRILSLAQPPIRPSSINPILFIPPAMVLSFILASVLALVRAQSDSSLRSEHEVSELLGIPCIGLVPELGRLRGSRPHQHLLKQRFSPYAEAIRSVVTALQISSANRAQKVLLFSSSVPAEGKTTLAVSVATYLAMLGRRVVVVDLDFRRPSLLRELDGRSDSGLLDVLHQRCSISASVQRVPGLPLEFLPAPQGIQIEPLSLFSSAEISRFIRDLRNHYDYVVIDSAPLLAVAEARLLMLLADKVLFVVRWGKTRREIVRNALKLMPKSALESDTIGNRVSAVVSRVNLKRHARYNYGDSGECLMDYRDYFSPPAKILSLDKPA